MNFKFLVFILTLQLCSGPVQNIFAQTTLIDPATQGGFEAGVTFPANGWTVVNSSPAQANQWYCSTGATGFTGARCAHIGTAAGNNTYNVNATSVVHFYRDITFPAGQPNIVLAFSWKGYGESIFDYIQVFVVPTSTTVSAGTQLFSGQIGTNLNQSTTWQTASISLPCATAGTTQRLVFSWINDGSIGTDPAGAIDNISLISSASSTCSSLMGSGVVTVPSIPYNSGAGTTCGKGNDLTAANTAVCGSGVYLTGEDQVWVITPASSGTYSFNLSAPSASYTGLMLYQGCPVASCTSPAGSCVNFAQSFTGDKSFCANLTAGVTYYLVLDSWTSPSCNAFSNLSITAVGATTCTSLLGIGVTTIASLPYVSPPGTTCGAVDNLTPTNTVACGSTNYLTGEDQVWIFTPTSTGQVTITLSAPSASYTGLMLYAGCPTGGCGPGPGTCVDYEQSSSGSKSFCANVVAGTTYYLVLDSYAFPTCNSYNSLSVSSVTTGTPGNTCVSPVIIPSLPYAAASQSTTCKGDDYTFLTPGICNGTFAYGEDIVYSFNVASAQCIGIQITGASNNNIGCMVYQGCPGSGGICLGGCIGAVSGTLTGSVSLPAAGTYYLIIDTQLPSSSVTFDLSIVSFGSGAANDMPFQAIPIPYNIPIVGNNTCSGGIDEPTVQPVCFQPAGNTMNSVWYSFAAPPSGCVILRTMLGTLNNTQMAVYGPVSGTIPAGSGNTLTMVGCSQDLPTCGFNTYAASQLNLTGLAPGLTYYILVDGYAGLTGSFSLFLMDAGVGCNATLPPVPGQDCDLAFPVCKTNIAVANPGPQAVGNNCEFGSNMNCLLSGERGSYWYKVNIVANGFLEFDIIPNDWPGAPSTAATDYDFAIWKTKTAGSPGPANCTNLNTVAPVACNYSPLGVTGCFSAANGNSPAAYPGFGGAYQSRINVATGDEYLLVVSNFSNSTAGFALNFSASSPIGTAPPIGGTLVWTGSLSTDWYNPENWGGCAIPNCIFNVTIPPGPANQPSISGTSAVCGSIDINTGATLTLQANAQLKICKNLVNTGTITALTNSTILVQSDSVLQNQSMTGSLTGINKLWNLVVNKPSTAGGNTVTLVNNLDVAGNFTVGNSATYAGGQFIAVNQYHKVAGNFTVYYSAVPYAVYTNTGGTLEFNGTTAQSYLNRGSVYNVHLNHTGPGITLGNSGATDWMTITGTLTLTQGKIITAANRVSVINTTPASVGTGTNTSFIDGNLKRFFAATGGSYDFPVGTALKGFQRINFNFGSVNDRTNATVSFNNTSPAVPMPFLGPECLSTPYNQPTLNNGLWNVLPIPATGVASYTVTAFNNNYTNPQSGFTVMSKFGAGAWGLNGTCVPSSPINAVQRNSISNMSTPAQYAIAQSVTPLPVELIFLEAKPAGNTIQVRWITASELNNLGFEIERATTPHEFSKIGWVEGHGTTSQMNSYLFTDRNVEVGTTYYYRLRQIDFDGTASYSSIVYARILPGEISASITPNPFSGATTLLLNLDAPSKVKIDIINSLGQVLPWILESDFSIGMHSFDFNSLTLGLAKGVYTFQVRVNERIALVRGINQD